MPNSSLLAFAYLVMTTTALAGGYPVESSSWEDIRAHKRVTFNDPTVALTTQYGTRHYSAFNACLDHDTVYLQNHAAVEICVRESRAWKGTPARCLEKTRVIPNSPVVWTDTYCAKWVRRGLKDPHPTCGQTASYEVNYAEPFTISVYAISQDRHNPTQRGRKLFDKMLMIPTCK